MGDLGDVMTDGNWKAKIDLVDNLIQIQGPNSVVGRSLVVHNNADDLGMKREGSIGICGLR